MDEIITWFEKLWATLLYQFNIAFIVDSRWRYITNGLKVTLQTTFNALLLGVVLGVLIAVVRSTWDMNKAAMNSGVRLLLGIPNALCQFYLTVIRGTPVVVQLMIFYFVVFPGSRNGLGVASLAFGINSGAYVAEIVRGGIMSIDSGQMEAGRSLGFGYGKTMWYIVLPQAFKNILPALANEFIVLLKETAVVGYVAVSDLMRGANIIMSVTYLAFMPLVSVALIYLAMVMLFSWLVGKLERRLRNSDH